jgi:hypothetical protein
VENRNLLFLILGLFFYFPSVSLELPYHEQHFRPFQVAADAPPNPQKPRESGLSRLPTIENETVHMNMRKRKASKGIAAGAGRQASLQ